MARRRGRRWTTSSTQLPKNRAGPVAQSYAELQSLPALFDAVRRPPVPRPGSYWSAIRALFQAIEVSLVTLDILGQAAARHAHRSDPTALAGILHWMVAFAKAWGDMAWRIGDIAPVSSSAATGHHLVLSASQNWTALQVTETSLAVALKNVVQDYEESRAQINQAITSDLLRYVMLERIGLEQCTALGASIDYTGLVRPTEIRSAVLERKLSGDTVFLQFRAAHQMPEILAEAVNDHIEQAIICIQSSDLPTTVELLSRADRLLDAIVFLANILVDNLKTHEYHAIRENLGLTSGSHSVGIHFHLMRDLYPALKAAIDDTSTRRAGSADPLLAVVQHQVRSLGLHLDRWRLSHLNLPRTNLGGAGTGTRSLTGSTDALLTVAGMRDSARMRDLPDATGEFRATDWLTDSLALAGIERRLLGVIASQTQDRFPDVQERSGRFAAPSDFRPPSRRLTREDDRS
jgi:hypothetical protein